VFSCCVDWYAVLLVAIHHTIVIVVRSSLYTFHLFVRHARFGSNVRSCVTSGLYTDIMSHNIYIRRRTKSITHESKRTHKLLSRKAAHFACGPIRVTNWEPISCRIWKNLRMGFLGSSCCASSAADTSFLHQNNHRKKTQVDNRVTIIDDE
jgi:hypothetical protein